MICDKDTNKVFLAEGIKGYEKVAAQLLMKLCDEEIPVEYLPCSKSKKHVWARDYMPIQTMDGYVQYVYDPDYLKKDRDYIPDYDAICRKLGFKFVKTKLVIDGGNVVRGERGVIMTEKVLLENHLVPYDLELFENLFGCRVSIIPWDRYDIFGHADGMVRFIDRDTVLMNNYIDCDWSLREALLETLKREGYRVEELHYDKPRCSKNSWAYLNFLQVKNRIFVPGLGIEEDWMAVEQLKEYYPDHRVILIPDCLELVRDGGALNCVTWNIYSIEEDEQRADTDSERLPE